VSTTEPPPDTREGARRSSERAARATTSGAVSRVVLIVVVAGVLISWALVASVHARDRFMVGWGEGAQMALSGSAADGVLYPPIFDGRSFGGTRMMPVPILLQAGSSLLIHDPLLASKLATYLTFLLLAAVLYRTLRSLGCSPLTALGFVTVLVATQVGMVTSLRISPDALPVALQLGALMLIADRRSRRGVAVAALLCAVAFFSKLSGLWAPAAIVTWFAVRDRRAAWTFAAVFGLCAATLAGLFHLVSEGRFEENVVGLAFAGERAGPDLRWAWTVIGSSPAAALGVFVLLPIAALGAIRAVGERRPTIYHVAAGFSVVILLVVLTDRGATTNHLLDVSVLIIVLAGYAVARGIAAHEVAPGFPLARFVLLVALVSSFTASLAPATAQAIRSLLTGTEDPAYARRPLDDLLDPGDQILSEDPTVPLELGMRPVVLDPFMLPAIASEHPEWIRDLVERIEERAFDAVVLVRDLDDAPRDWYSRLHLGPAVVDAIREHYQFQATTGGYFVYRPVPLDGSS
jgi:hypothetical protein